MKVYCQLYRQYGFFTCCTDNCCYLPCPCIDGQLFGFTATLRDSETGALLPGATLSLFSGGTLYRSGASGLAGAVTFAGLPAGVYELRQTTAPSGYLPDPNSHTVVVAANGQVSIDGYPAAGFTLYNSKVV